MLDLTTCQRRIVEFIQKHLATVGYPPTRAEIASHFRYRSLTTVEDHLRLIERKGFLKIDSKARGLRVLSPNQPTRRPLLDIPLYGSIPAGLPEDREGEILRYLTVDADTIKARLSPDAFALQVKGDSMIDKHILNGDHVIIEPRRTPAHGEVVAALIDDQTTLKTLVIKNGKPYLKAENPRYRDLIPKSDLVIKGVAVAVLRHLAKV